MFIKYWEGVQISSEQCNIWMALFWTLNLIPGILSKHGRVIWAGYCCPSVGVTGITLEQQAEKGANTAKQEELLWERSVSTLGSWRRLLKKKKINKVCDQGLSWQLQAKRVLPPRSFPSSQLSLPKGCSETLIYQKPWGYMAFGW